MIIGLLRCLFPAATAAALSALASMTITAHAQMHVQKELEILEVYECLFA